MSPGSLVEFVSFISTLRAKWNLIGLSLSEGAWCRSVLRLTVVAVKALIWPSSHCRCYQGLRQEA